MRNFKISNAFAKQIRRICSQAVIEVARSAYFLRPKEFLSYETNGSFVQKEKKIVKKYRLPRLKVEIYYHSFCSVDIKLPIFVAKMHKDLLFSFFLE